MFIKKLKAFDLDSLWLTSLLWDSFRFKKPKLEAELLQTKKRSQTLRAQSQLLHKEQESWID